MGVNYRTDTVKKLFKMEKCATGRTKDVINKSLKEARDESVVLFQERVL